MMGLGDPLRVLANLLIDPDHDLADTDAINPCIPIPWIVRLSERNVEHVARAFKEVRVGGLFYAMRDPMLSLWHNPLAHRLLSGRICAPRNPSYHS